MPDKPHHSGYHHGLGQSMTDEEEPPEEDDDLIGRKCGICNGGQDFFDAVVVSAFGGVTQQLEGCGPTLVHPVFMFLLSIPLMMAQFSALFYFRVDMDLTNPVHSPSKDKQWGTMMLTMKLLMAVIVQLFMFSRLMQSVQQFVFLVNPTTWEDIDRPDAASFKMRFASWIFRPPFLAPPAILAVVWHFLIDYIICIDSVSIILGSTRVKEAIYDALAIAFIAELGAKWWSVTSTVFHFEDFSDFEFRMGSKKWRREVRAKAWCPLPACTKFLQREQGGRILELGLSFLIVVLVYLRQVIVVVHALETNILPVARDVCTLWKLDRVSTANRRLDVWSISGSIFSAMESYLLLSSPDAIKDVAPGYCNETYERLKVSGIPKMFDKDPRIIWTSSVIILLFLGLPQVYYLTYRCIRQRLYPEHWIESFEADSEEHQRRSGRKRPSGIAGDTDALLQTQVAKLQEEAKFLREELAKLLVR